MSQPWDAALGRSPPNSHRTCALPPNSGLSFRGATASENMGIKFNCHACGKKLNVKAFLAGKRGICPHCGAKVDIPSESQVGVAAGSGAARFTAQEAAPASAVPVSGPESHHSNGSTGGDAISAAPVSNTSFPQSGFPGAMASAAAATPTATPVPAQPAAPADPIAEAPGAVWYVRPPSGGQFGPASGEIMRKWIGEGRVSADSLIWREGWAEWQSASSIFPSLSGGASPPPPSSPVVPASTPAFTAGPSSLPSEPSTPRTFPRRKSSNSLAVILVVVLTLASFGLLGILIAVIQFVN